MDCSQVVKPQLGLDGKIEMLKKSYPVSSICHLPGNASDGFSNPTTAIFLVSLQYDGYKAWSMLKSVT